MTPRLTALHRHPVKAVGAEALDRTALHAGGMMPGDRVWALAHAGSRHDPAVDGGWARCTTFLRGAAIPTLMAVTTEGAPGGPITFRHPDAAPLTADPGTAEGEAALLAWVAALLPDTAPRPTALVRADRGMTDSPRRAVSIMSDDSLADLSARVGAPLDRRRFRGALWVAGLAPWAEMALEGREIRVGPVRLRVLHPIERCSSIQASPDTGRRDSDVLGALASLGHQDFGMLAEVLSDGEIALGDPLSVL